QVAPSMRSRGCRQLRAFMEACRQRHKKMSGRTMFGLLRKALPALVCIMSLWLSDHFGQQFVVENRTGSGGNIAAAAAISSAPDGYTLLFVAPNNAISTSLYKKLPYDFLRDTTPVASIMQLTN